MLTPIEAMSMEAMTAKGVVPKVAMAAEGVVLEGVPEEMPVEVPKSPCTPIPTLATEGPKIKKGKQATPSQLVHTSPRKHPKKVKPTAQEKGKTINLEPEEDDFEDIPMDDEDVVMEREDVKIVGSDPITKFPEYVPPCKGNAKVPKDIDESKITLHTPLLLNKIVFEGPCLGHVPLLKLEDWDLANTEWFPHLATDQLMHSVFHKSTGVTVFEP